MMADLAVLQDVLDYWPEIAKGLGSTLWLSVLITVTGLVGGIFVFYLTLSSSSLCRRAVQGYISIFVGTPLIVFLFLLYYGLPQWGLKLTPFTVALLGFTINISAYNARYMTTAYNGLDPSELEAAKAQGFTRQQIFRLITLPQVLRLSIPALTNQAIQNLKDTSLVFLIQYVEFFAQMQEVAMRTFRFFDVYLLTGLVYLILVWGVSSAAKRAESFAAPPAWQA
jgi:polar amino acid transport system permease protein